MSSWRDRITVNPNLCGGRPCIRGMRIPVADIFKLYEADLTQDQILDKFPDLEKQDLEAAFKFVISKLDYPMLPYDDLD
jgi:uncharacterized protein (DUF433 family)